MARRPAVTTKAKNELKESEGTIKPEKLAPGKLNAVILIWGTNTVAK